MEAPISDDEFENLKRQGKIGGTRPLQGNLPETP
jgi:hypothetical protein